MLIERLDHIALSVPDASVAASEYAAVLDRPSEGARVQTENIGLVLETAAGASSPAFRLVFATRDLDAARHRLQRRALPGSLAVNSSSRFDIDPAATHGVPISLVQAGEATRAATSDRDIAGLDHVVIHTADPERAVALYGGRLGLDLRLDRTHATLGVRQIFFVCGDLVVEIVHSAKAEGAGRPDGIWGLAWRAHDIDRARQRMLTQGIAATEIKDGRRPGTRVFTLKSHVSGVPSLVIGGEGLKRG